MANICRMLVPIPHNEHHYSVSQICTNKKKEKGKKRKTLMSTRQGLERQNSARAVEHMNSDLEMLEFKSWH